MYTMLPTWFIVSNKLDAPQTKLILLKSTYVKKLVTVKRKDD